MDSFCEYLIKMRKTLKEHLIVALIWITAFFLTFVVVDMALKNPAVWGIIVIAVVGLFYGALKLSALFNVEYEMIAVNRDLDIDKITAKSSRKRMITVHLDKIEEYGEYNQRALEHLKSKKFDFKIICANPEDKASYLIYRHPKKGLSLVVFAVSDNLESEVLKSVPRMLIIK